MQERKIPTIIGLLLVGAAVMIFRLAFDRIGPILTRATEATAPKSVTVSNVSDSTFTVSWMTTSPTSGALRVDGAPSTSVYYDDRWSVSGASGKLDTPTYSTHSVTVRALKPETTYAFRILSNDRSYLNDGKPYQVRTGPKITGVGTSLEPAYGQLVAPSGNAVEGGLVYLSLEGVQMLSTLTKSSGTWVIPLNLARSAELSSYMTASERIDESIIIRVPQGEASAVTDTLNDNPVPVMTVGKTYDFRKIQAEGKKTPNLAQAAPGVLGTTAQHTVSITKPTQGAAIPSNLPLFQGTGIPGNQLLIVIGIDQPMSDSVIIGADGMWRYTPPKPLSEGKQSVTITTSDAKNQTVALTHVFEILKSGTQVLGEATPSATLTPTIDMTPTPTSTLAGEPIPETGSPLPLLLLLILGVSLVSSGAFILIK